MSLLREVQQKHIASLPDKVGFSPEWRVLDIGIGGDKDRPSDNFKFFPAHQFDTLDNNASWKPTIFGDICNPPIPSSQYDLVICCQTLEHVWDVHRALREIHRILKSGGKAILDIPWMYEFHGLPDQPDDDFWRISHHALTRLANEVGLAGEAQLVDGILTSMVCQKS